MPDALLALLCCGPFALSLVLGLWCAEWEQEMRRSDDEPQRERMSR